MIETRLTEDQIATIVENEVGDFTPTEYCDEVKDTMNLSHLRTLEFVVDKLIDDIQLCTAYGENCDISSRRFGISARVWLEEKRDWLNDILKEEERDD